MRHPIPGVLVLLLSCLLGACQQYDVTVNERRVYTPLPLFTDFSAADPSLQRCLESTINSHKISSASQLQELSCRSAGIRSLDGLATFSSLRSLDLSGNQIDNIAPLAEVFNLESVYLSDNQIVDPLPLAELQALNSVDLAGNRSLRCPDRQALLRVSHLRLPVHCDN
ncbi:leucine-rich repeat domain-containing protein [Parahaliea mediterranea]|uniref:leucine-rich repeat domain-containing protein n=1 Tax=Parahaliea mediterranea TaxID=651086 RepID=UPI0013008C46|nr:leucine-rich repeat domain-containing protein [Parahaliea mediterranea]